MKRRQSRSLNPPGMHAQSLCLTSRNVVTGTRGTSVGGMDSPIRLRHSLSPRTHVSDRASWTRSVGNPEVWIHIAVRHWNLAHAARGHRVIEVSPDKRPSGGNERRGSENPGTSHDPAASAMSRLNLCTIRARSTGLVGSPNGASARLSKDPPSDNATRTIAAAHVGNSRSISGSSEIRTRRATSAIREPDSSSRLRGHSASGPRTAIAPRQNGIEYRASSSDSGSTAFASRTALLNVCTWMRLMSSSFNCRDRTKSSRQSTAA